jgi:hypothetical protein
MRKIEMLPQPDDFSCGPTCLHAIYRFYGDTLPLSKIIKGIPSLKSGGTLDVFLANHALERGYAATIYTYNLKLFDPTWFKSNVIELSKKLQAQFEYKAEVPRFRMATRGYLEYLNLGGRLRFEDLTSSLIRRYLIRNIPILTGLSATYLYRSPREFGPDDRYDDIRGEPSGHFVVLYDYDRETREVSIADPFNPNPFFGGYYYRVKIERVICSILLGIVTYDANLLIIEPKGSRTLISHDGNQSICS